MPKKVIKYYLENDIVDRSESAVLAANPNLIGLVPYQYQSLRTLMFPRGLERGENFSSFITTVLGSDMQMPDQTIGMMYEAGEPNEVADSRFFQDTIGSEYGTLIVAFRLKAALVSTNPGILEQLDLRTRSVLDCNIRAMTQQPAAESFNANLIPGSIDYSIGPITCRWIKSREYSSQQIITWYTLQYDRYFVR